jgi:murein DD-endopeptidase MepM/ murein hydrolase activator NlpD
LLAAAGGLALAPILINALAGKDKTEREDIPSLLQAYAASAGQAPTMDLSKVVQQTVQAAPINATRADVRQILPSELSYATGSAYIYNDDQIKRYSQDASGYGQFKQYVSGELTSGAGASPQTRSNMVMDTIAHFGQAAGQDMAKFLAQRQPGSLDLSSFYSEMASSDVDTRAKIGEGVDQILEDRRSVAAGISPALGGEENIGQIAQIVGAVATAPTVDPRMIAEFQDTLERAGIAGDQSLYSAVTQGAGPAPNVPQGAAARFTGMNKEADTRTDEEKKRDANVAFFTQLQQDPDNLAKVIAGSGGIFTEGMSPEAMADAALAADAGQLDMFSFVQSTTKQLLANAGKSNAAIQGILGAPVIANAITSQDPRVQYRAGVQTYNRLLQQTGGLPGVIGAAEQGLATGIDPTQMQAQIYEFVIQRAQQQLQYRQPFMSRSQFLFQTGQQQAQLVANSQGAINQPDVQQQALDTMNQLKGQYGEFYKNILMAEKQFQWQKARAQEDFSITRDRMEYQYNLMRTRELQAYNLQRKYAEFDFDLSRERSQADFQRSQKQASSDYYLGRRRQEEDFNHQVLVMTEQAASSMYDIYQRVTVQRTVSTGSLLTNARDQLTQMRDQEANLSRLREMGLSDTAIQQMGLTDPKNAQQLARFMQDIMQNPALVGEFNKQFKQRMKAAGDLVTDQSSMEWQEFTRQYNLARDRGAQDFERAMRRGRHEFTIQMGRSEEDFKRMLERQHHQLDITMDQQAEDYNTTLTNMEDDLARQLHRAQVDISRMATEIVASFPQVMNQVLPLLNQKGQEEVRKVVKTFRDANQLIRGVADDTNSLLRNKWGIELKDTPSPGHIQLPGGGPDPTGGPRGVPRGTHGTPPTQTIQEKGSGSDDLTVYFPLPAGSYSVGTPFGERGSAWASGYHTGQDFPAPVGTPIEATMAGRATFAGWQSATAYGNMTDLYHGKNQRNQDVSTRYAHQSKIIISPQDMVAGGQHIGNVGYTGNVIPDSPAGAHLHFELLLDGQAVDPMQLFEGQHITLSPGDIKGGMPVFSRKAWLERVWPALERAGAKVSFAGGFPSDPKNYLSRKMNITSLAALQKKAGRHHETVRQFLDAGTGRAGTPGGSAPDAPSDVHGNVALGKALAARRGWTGDEWDALYTLWDHESGWSSSADNPISSAYGIPQHLLSYGYPPGYVDHTTGSGANMRGYGGDPSVQIRWGLNYIKDRYKDPSSAWSFWQGHNWYGEGGVFNGAQTIGVGERGSEIVLPLDARGAKFVSSLTQEMRQSSVSGSTPMRSTHISYHQQIDHRTQFNGPIQVTSNDVNEFVAQMRMRQRHQNLVQPALATR